MFGSAETWSGNMYHGVPSAASTWLRSRASGGWRGGLVAGGETLPDVPVISYAVAVPPGVDDVTVVEQAVDEGACHDVVPEDRAPVFEVHVSERTASRLLARWFLLRWVWPVRSSYMLNQ